MRRGHNEIGGWRSENQRHFRPRSSGNQHFRSLRSYGLPDPTRFPPPNSRSARPFHSRSENFDQNLSEHQDRNRYRYNRYNSYHRPHQSSDREILPATLQTRHNADKHNIRNTFKEQSTFYKDIHVDNFHINSMGDVDHRQLPRMREPFIQPFTNPWTTESNIKQPIEGFSNKTIGTESGEFTKFSAEYTGHRPPASDHYACNPTHSFSAIENSHSFSRSVNDTVDLIRKRLLNRNEQQQNQSENFVENQNSSNQIENRLEEKSNSLTNAEQETPIKKKYQKHSGKANCAKIKNKIVHQLFKMDKEKIHKLMDNPNSSTKFEYAISSLITESQNSFNRHLRSAAEKSLCSSSAEFMQNDNNTIYEDTFMKQMQCILDPQDTVLLEDIKPIVMAELTKALQIGECDQRYDMGEDDIAFSQQNEQQICNQYPSNEFSYELYPDNNEYEHNNLPLHYPQNENVGNKPNIFKAYNDSQSYYHKSKPIFERRPRRKSHNFNEESTPSEPAFYNQSVNHTESADEDMRPNVSQPLFDSNPEQFSEEDDPFAELDKQYHVAVDPDLIEQDDIPVHEPANDIHKTNSITIKTEPFLSEINSIEITEELSHQLQEIAKSTSHILNQNNKINDSLPLTYDGSSVQSTQEEKLNSNNIISNQENKAYPLISANEIKNENKTKPKSTEMTKENEKLDHVTPINNSALAPNSRKRSIDQRPSHRKEKRKKSELCQSESNKQILNKNIIINVNDCVSKKSENCEAPKSVFNLFFSKEENKIISKENQKTCSIDKDYTEKHVKRKETPKKTNENYAKTRKDSTSSQSTSPNENNLNCNIHVQNKTEGKTTLKSIDMFTEQPKKINIHHAHRNTAPTQSVVPKINIDNTPKTKSQLFRQISKKHIAIQATRKCHAKETQTEMKKYAVKAIQADILPNKSVSKSTDAFERMKEIDLEIQVLLQEKFKLYNSIETKDSDTNSMQTLGMTVLNVDQFHDEENEIAGDMLTDDAIVDEFANIPVEELEKIALETVHEQRNENQRVEKRNRRRKISYQDSVKSESPTTVSKRKSRKTKSPNISLIEQIITDDRPLEDIISLDDLEVPHKATKSKKQKTKQIAKKKKGTEKIKIIKSNTANFVIKECSVVLIKTDLSNYFQLPELQKPKSPLKVIEEQKQEVIDETNQKETVHIEENIIGDSNESHIQIDMLDVSEDIVVGDSCELKLLGDKEIIENGSVPISEEIILDNSQSSMEDVTTPAVCQGGVCKMYDYSSDENLRRDSIIVTGNADAVLAIECVDNNFLAACLDGNVYYFSCEGQLISTLRGSNLAVTCLTIVREKYGTTVYTGSLDSRIRYYELETGLEKGPECNVLSPIQTMDRAWDTVFVGTRTGFVLQFECKNNMLIPVSTVKFSDQSILALRAMKEGPRKVLLVAARSENVSIKDAQTGLLLRTLEGPKMTVYSLLYEDGKVYCGTSSHHIQVFDYTSGSHVGTHEGGKGAVCLRAYGGLLFAGCYDGCVYVYREGEGQPFAQIRGPSLMLLSLAVIGSKIIAGYKDRSLYIWKIPLCILEEMIL